MMIRDFFFKPRFSVGDLVVIFVATEIGEHLEPVVGWGWGLAAVVVVAVVGTAVVALLDQLVFPVKGGTK